VVTALVAKDGDMFTPEFFALLRAVTDQVFFLPGVDRSPCAGACASSPDYTCTARPRTLGEPLSGEPLVGGFIRFFLPVTRRAVLSGIPGAAQWLVLRSGRRAATDA